jgi:site-specific recombinase XerD
MLSEAVEAFLVSCDGAKSPATVKWYRRRLGDLCGFLGACDVATITVFDLRRFRASVAGRGLSVWTLHGYVRAVRRLFRWLADEGVLPVHVASRLELPKLPKRPRLGIPRDDAEKILMVARNTSPRDYAMVLFLAVTACRVGGLVGLRIADVDFARARAWVCEKGDKSRVVYLEARSLAALRAWLAVRPEVGHPFVFTSSRTGQPLTTSGVYQALRDLARAAGVPHGWNPHNWRHGAARGMQAAGMPTGQLSLILGHSDVRVTVEFYGTCDEDELAAAHARYAWLGVGDS